MKARENAERSLAEFENWAKNRPTPPHPFAGLGRVGIDLEKLGARMEFSCLPGSCVVTLSNGAFAATGVGTTGNSTHQRAKDAYQKELA